MCPPPNPSLTPVRAGLGSPDFEAILQWPFPEQPFYVAQVKRLLQTDIRHRILHRFGVLWVYRDPEGHRVGFGTLDIWPEYPEYTGGKPHTYIPLLAVHPDFERRGHGRRIVEHLVGEAVLLTDGNSHLSKLLFLDVYTANEGAIKLYTKCGFTTLNPDAPIPHPQENNEPYFVMGRNLLIPPA